MTPPTKNVSLASTSTSTQRNMPPNLNKTNDRESETPQESHPFTSNKNTTMAQKKNM